MSWLGRGVGPPADLESAIERHLAPALDGLGPDPLFRRRLRGHIVNRYVAALEGVSDEKRRLGTEMGRLGRAVLYASFALAFSMTGVMAASQQAVPGDVFYPIKLQIESLRARVVPDHMLDDVAAHSLRERIAELQRLADVGNWTAVAAHTEVVDAAHRALVALSPSADAAAEHLEVPLGLLEGLPDRARAGLEAMVSDEPPAPRPSGSGVPGRDAGAGAPPHPGNEAPGSRAATPAGPARGGGTPAVEPDGSEEPASTPAPASAKPRPSRGLLPAAGSDDEDQATPSPTPSATPSSTP